MNAPQKPHTLLVLCCAVPPAESRVDKVLHVDWRLWTWGFFQLGEGLISYFFLIWWFVADTCTTQIGLLSNSDPYNLNWLIVCPKAELHATHCSPTWKCKTSSSASQPIHAKEPVCIQSLKDSSPKSYPSTTLQPQWDHNPATTCRPPVPPAWYPPALGASGRYPLMDFPERGMRASPITVLQIYAYYVPSRFLCLGFYYTRATQPEQWLGQTTVAICLSTALWNLACSRKIKHSYATSKWLTNSDT